MPGAQSTADRSPIASRDDIEGVLGELDPGKMLAIVELRPRIADVEAASLWLSGDADVYGTAAPLKGAAAAIVAILTEGEDEER